MGETDKTRQQREALRKVKARQADSGRRASDGMLRFLGATLYHERRRSADEDKQHREQSDD